MEKSARQFVPDSCQESGTNWVFILTEVFVPQPV
jgi:hypothetical protein